MNLSCVSSAHGTRMNSSCWTRRTPWPWSAASRDPAALIVTSANGVVKLTGSVHRVQKKDRIEGVVREALRHANLKDHQIVNDLTVV